MEGFERKRTQDIKVRYSSPPHSTTTCCRLSSSLLQTVLGDYIHAQMLLHAKALELYTIAHQNLQSISEEENVQVICDDKYLEALWGGGGRLREPTLHLIPVYYK